MKRSFFHGMYSRLGSLVTMLCLLPLFAGMVDDSVLERAGEYYSTKAVSGCTSNQSAVQNSSLKLKPLTEQTASPLAKALYNAYEFVFCKVLKLACFTAGTPIETENGPQAIETIQPGDLVWCRDDDDPSAPLQLKPVEQVFERWARVLEVNLPGGVSIGTTEEHPFWVVGKGWVRAGDLVPGDHLLGEDGQEVAVESIRQTEDYEKVYNLRVADNHTYFVGGDGWGFDVWVHNACKNWINFESEVRNIYKELIISARRFTTNTGKTRIADGFIKSKKIPLIAIEAKYVKYWEKSISNPSSLVGQKGFAEVVREKLIKQFTDYSNSFKKTIVHSNSNEFISYYSSVLKERGISNVTFTFTPWK